MENFLACESIIYIEKNIFEGDKMASTRLPEQKIILCGEYGAGKSSIFRRYANNTFVTSTDRSSTLGLDHFSKSFTVNDREVKVNIKSMFTHSNFFHGQFNFFAFTFLR